MSDTPGSQPTPSTPPAVEPITANNLATYAGGLAAGGMFYFLGSKGINLPAGYEAGVAAVFAGIIGQLVGRIIKGPPK